MYVAAAVFAARPDDGRLIQSAQARQPVARRHHIFLRQGVRLCSSRLRRCTGLTAFGGVVYLRETGKQIHCGVVLFASSG